MTGPKFSSSYKVVSAKANPYTGKSEAVMRSRQTGRPTLARRRQILESAMLDGAAWEEDSAQSLENFIAAVGGKRFKPKRLGTNSVKHFEQLDRTGNTF